MPMLVLPFPAINPVLVQWGPLAIRWYALAYIAGLVLGWRLIRRVVLDDRYWKGAKRPTPRASTTCSFIAPSGSSSAGGSATSCSTIPHYYLAHPLDVFKVWEGGMAFHGGLIGCFIGMALFARRYRTSLHDRDRTSARWPLRSACSSAGSPISSGPNSGAGRPTSRGRWCSREPTACRAIRARFTRRCSRACWLLSSFMRSPTGARCASAGLIAGAFGVLYGAARIFSEFFREPDPRLEDLGRGLTMGMLLSAPMILIGLGLIAASLRRKGS